MNKTAFKKPFILGILFFLPVIFLLFLYPSKHNYNTLDIVNETVIDLNNFSNNEVKLKGNITILNFVGSEPLLKTTATLNLKELIYDKFLGFKRFQVVTIATNDSETELQELRKQLLDYDALKYWKFITGTPSQIQEVYNSLKTEKNLDRNFATDQVFIIDTEINQRGRLDDRSDNELAKQSEIYGLSSYNCIEVAEIKNKMSEDLRILFTEYRQQRKGNFNSSSRRAQDLKNNEEN
jgi:cytochrome oxidase Cu insertion factor (SCO1/SenC/PrrC family)